MTIVAFQSPIEDSASFSLEKYLQDFVVANREKTPLAKTLDIYVEDEEKAVEFNTDVGENRYPGPRPFDRRLDRD